MANPTIRNLHYIRQKDPKLAEAFDDLVKAMGNVSVQTVTHPDGANVQPAPVNSVKVVAQDGIYHATITDHNPVYRGVNYFLEYDTDPTFPSPQVIDNKSSRTWRGHLGNQSLYWRAYSQYPQGGAPSTPVAHGGAQPVAVVGGGTISGPSLLPSTGSGTASSDGTQGGSGAGKTIARLQANGRLPTL